MRTALVCLFALFCLQAFSQHPSWLPTGAEITYTEVAFGLPPDNHPVVHTVLEAYSIGATDVRILRGTRCGCSTLPEQPQYRLHREGDLVFYVNPVDSVEYPLYDYSAKVGDTVQAISSLYGTPAYAMMVVDSVVLENYGDTAVYVQKLAPVTGDAYIDVVVGLFAKSFVFPEFQACDPGCGFVSSYSDDAREICFEPSTCYNDDLDFAYSPFSSDQTYFFKGLGSKYYGVSHQLSHAPNGGVMFTPPQAFITNHEDLGCLRNDRGGWAYRKLEVFPDTLLRFYNSRNESIDVFLGIEVGVTWEAYRSDEQSIEARVDRYELRDFDGVTDSVVCIRFDGLNSELCLSKSHGLVEMPGFQQFPDYDDPRFPYEREQQFTTIGRQPTWLDIVGGSSLSLSWNGAMSLEPGDVIHVEETQLNYNSGTVNRDKLVYINKRFVDGGTEWLWHRERRQYYDLIDSLFIDSRDTFYQFVSNEELYQGPMNFLPGSAAATMQGEGTVTSGEFFNNRVVKSIPPYNIFKEDTCWYEIVISQDYFAPRKWIQGLAGPYYENIGPPMFYSSRLLKYYNKVNGEEWGSPFDFTVSVKNIESVGRINVYPNPASSQIVIESDDRETVEVKFIGPDGAVHLVRNAVLNDPIDIEILNPGVYFCQIRSEGNTHTRKVIVVR